MNRYQIPIIDTTEDWDAFLTNWRGGRVYETQSGSNASSWILNVRSDVVVRNSKTNGKRMLHLNSADNTWSWREH